MKFSSEIKVGITVLLAAIAAVIGFRFMSDVPVFRQTLQVETVFNRVDGLATGSQIYIKGVKVGSVGNMEFTDTDSVQVTMRLDVPNSIPRGSVALLTSLGLIEGKSIVIELGDSDERVEFGEKIEGIYVESMMEVLGSKGEELGEDVSASLGELNLFLRQLNRTLDDETRVTLNETMQSTATATRRIADLLEGKNNEITGAIDAASSMLVQLDSLATDSRPQIEALMSSIQENVDELEKLRTELESTTANLNSILQKIDEGEGTIGKLVNDPAVYDNLDELTKELTNLIKGINENPGRYLRHMSLIEIF